MFTRPLTVTGAYLNVNGTIDFHQMVMDRIENNEYILQNTLTDHSSSLIRIPQDRKYYADTAMMEDCLNCYNDYVYYGDNNEVLELVNEKINGMDVARWYLLPQAYSISVTPGSGIISVYKRTLQRMKLR